MCGDFLFEVVVILDDVVEIVEMCDGFDHVVCIYWVGYFVVFIFLLY